MKFVFEEISGEMVPRVPDTEGKQPGVDGKRYFDIVEAAVRMNIDELAMADAFRNVMPKNIATPRLKSAVGVALPAVGTPLDLLRRNEWPRLSDQDFLYLLAKYDEYGFNPFSKYLYVVDRDGGKGIEVRASIDCFRNTANSHPDSDGEAGPLFSDGNGAWLDYWPHKDRYPDAALVRVYRKSKSRPYEAIARWDSYAPKYVTPEGEEVVADFWQKMPDFMLGKCATALAIRKAFPDRFAGLYIAEEMEQANNPRPRGNGGGGGCRPPAASMLENVPLTKAEQLAETLQYPTPNSNFQLQIDMTDLGFKVEAERKKIIESLKIEMAKLYQQDEAAFYTAALLRLCANPKLYGSVGL